MLKKQSKTLIQKAIEAKKMREMAEEMNEAMMKAVVWNKVKKK
jgi:hypothetical protein